MSITSRIARRLQSCGSKVLLGAVALGALSVSARPADLFPFVLPWDDASPSVTNLSDLLEKPAGKHGFIKVKEGHLYAGDKRWRIFGVNLAFGANFPTKDDAPKIAARMAKYGINCVRFHHMDNQAAPGGIWAKDMKTFDPEQLDKLDWFIAKLKEQGIYTDLNLHVSRTYPDRPKAEKVGNESYDKCVDNFSAVLIALQKDYARDLLTHVNPYTGKAYINEPAVALVEINNENALLFEWWRGGLDTIAAPYRNELSELWTDFLKDHHGDDAAIKAAWSNGAREAGPELLKNGNFASLGGWNLETHQGAEATSNNSDPGDGQRLEIVTQKPGKEQWHVQMNQGGLKFTAGTSYTVTFQARSADSGKSMSVSASQAHEPWKVFGSKDIKLTPQWTKQRFSFVVKEEEDNGRIVFGGLGQQLGSVEIKDVSLTSSGIRGDVTRTNGAIPSFTRDEYAERTEQAQKDWYAFLWILEERYWPGMADFIRNDLKSKSLILGTQLFWSPFPIQARLDVIDSHAYWQHPHFPGKQWDMSNWTVKNVSMAGAENGGTLPRLALQRVAGKPYIVSEYNHAAPNTFASETFPLVCAFAALQDWDGIFAFAYSHRTNDWDKGFTPSFFDIDQHPTKMATLSASVGAFLRGDVAAAKGALVPTISAGDIFEQSRKGGPRIGAEHFGAKWQDAFVSRVGVSAGQQTKPVSSSAATGDVLTSDTGEFVWNGEKDKGVVTINAPKSKGVIGFIRGRTFELGGVKITPGTTREDWATIQATVLDGGDFASAKKILITATGYTENTGMKWTSDEKNSVGRNWGTRPSLVEGIPAAVQLPTKGKMKAWALDELGQRKSEVPVENGTIQIGPEHKTLWYEIVAE